MKRQPADSRIRGIGRRECRLDQVRGPALWTADGSRARATACGLQAREPGGGARPGILAGAVDVDRHRRATARATDPGTADRPGTLRPTRLRGPRWSRSSSPPGSARKTAWYRNLLADPDVSLVLPGGTFRAVAAPVTDPAAYAAGFRALIDGLGVVGRLTVGDLRDASPDRLAELRAGLPLVAIQPGRHRGRSTEHSAGFAGSVLLATLLAADRCLGGWPDGHVGSPASISPSGQATPQRT